MNKLWAIGALAFGVAACSQGGSIAGPAVDRAPQILARAAKDDGADEPGAVYTLTNQVTGNAVAVLARAADGTLTAAGSFATGGIGTGVGLGSQGAVTLSNDGRLLFAVNAGSSDVSVFRVSSDGLSLLSRTPSGGSQPTSVTVSGSVVYVLNAGGAGNISGFTVSNSGELTPIPGSTKSLSNAAAGPAQVSFSPDGRQLVVAEKATSRLDVYPVDESGVAGDRTSFASAGGTPFGFAFGLHNVLFVSEASAPGSASSYTLSRGGALQLVSGVVVTHQGAPCWAVVTNNGRFGFTGNGSGSVSAFSIAPDGTISLVAPNGASAVIPGGINDIALSRNSRFLYALQTGSTPGIQAYRIENDGSLTALGAVAGLPAGARGLAAF